MAYLFITAADLQQFCEQDDIEVLSQSTETKIEGIEKKAISVFEGYLSSRYDTDSCFETWDGEGDDPRHQALLMYLVDYILYMLYATEPDRMIPEMRIERKDEALDWLKMINSGKVTPGLPTIDSETETDINNPIKTGYSTKKFKGW